MFNKDGRTIMRQLGTEWDRIASGRSVVLVLGDSLGDSSMADGLLGLKTICKVGFLNEPPGDKQEALMNDYARATVGCVTSRPPRPGIIDPDPEFQVRQRGQWRKQQPTERTHSRAESDGVHP
eukprot:scaffold15670_cov112-Isochrysis_galbana.AAC.3